MNMHTIRLLAPSSLGSTRGSSAIFLAALFLGTAGVLVIPWDLMLSEGGIWGKLPGDLRRGLTLTEVFAHGLGIAIVLGGLALTIPATRPFMPRLIACAMLPGVIVNAIKWNVGRWRPSSFEAPNGASDFDTWVGWLPGWTERAGVEFEYAVQSFPSGHAATAFGFAVALSFLAPQARLYFFALAAAASIQRIVAGSHWTSDVLIGAAIGLAVSGLHVQRGGFGRLWSALERRLTRRATDLETEQAQQLSEKRKAA